MNLWLNDSALRFFFGGVLILLASHKPNPRLANAELGGAGSSLSPAAVPGGAQLIRGADLVLLHGRIWTGEPYAKP